MDMQLTCSRGSPWLVVGAFFGDLGIGEGMGHGTFDSLRMGSCPLEAHAPTAHVFFIIFIVSVFLRLCHLELHRPTHRFGQRLRHVVIICVHYMFFSFHVGSVHGQHMAGICLRCSDDCRLPGMCHRGQ